MPPMRIVGGARQGELHRDQSPTDRWSDVAVVESISSSPPAREPGLPAFICKMTVSAEVLRSRPRSASRPIGGPRIAPVDDRGDAVTPGTVDKSPGP